MSNTDFFFRKSEPPPSKFRLCGLNPWRSLDLSVHVVIRKGAPTNCTAMRRAFIVLLGKHVFFIDNEVMTTGDTMIYCRSMCQRGGDPVSRD